MSGESFEISAREADFLGVYAARYLVASRRTWSDLYIMPVCRMLECAKPSPAGIEPVIMMNAWGRTLHTRAFQMIVDKCRTLDRERKAPRTEPVVLTKAELSAVAWLCTCYALGRMTGAVDDVCTFLETHATHLEPKAVSWITALIRQTLRDGGGGMECDRVRWAEALLALEHEAEERDTAESVRRAWEVDHDQE